MGIHSGYRPSLDATVTTDEFAPYNVLLVNGNNYVSATQNNTFLDSSANRFSITRNGNTTQGSFSPYGNTWSSYFDGTGDYLSVPSNAAFAFGTGTFTIEGWIYITVGGQIQFMISSDNTSYWAFGVNASNQLIFRPESSTTNEQAGTTALALNTWHHIAAVREGTGTNQFKMYLNGVLEKTGTVSTNYSVNTGAFISSGRTGNNNVFNGYISNVRVVKGTAVYTAAFTPPTEPLTAVTNTSLLTCHANRFLDGSTNNFTVTKLGDSRIVKDSPFQLSTAYNQLTLGGSGYFDGTGDYLTVTNAAGFQFGTGDFEIDLWIYQPTLAATVILDSRASATASPYTIGFDASGLPYVYTGSIFTGSTGITAGQWNHVVWTRSASTLRIFVNGTSVYSASNTSTVTGGGSNLTICSIVSNGGQALNGYISDLRIIKGTGVTSVTVPTAPLTIDTNTQLLLSFTNAAIIDQTGENVLETLDGAQVSRTQSKFENAVYFDGSGDYLKTVDNQAFSFGSGNFTVEAWVWLDSTANPGRSDGLKTVTVFSTGSSSSNDSSFAIYGNSSTPGIGLEFYQVSPSLALSVAATVTNNTWVHVAWTRTGTSFYGFVNGTRYTLGTTSAAIGSATSPKVGYANTSGYTNAFKGYIDDLRITRGVARYTANFTPPARALPITRFG